MHNLDHLQSDIERALFLQDTLIGFATQDKCGGSAEDYEHLRHYFVSQHSTKPLVPYWLRTSRNTNQYWHFIKNKFPTYAERREFIWTEMRPLLEFCEGLNSVPAEGSISDVLLRFDEGGVHEAWAKALERRQSDPAGAITAARTLIESVCKRILDELDIEYDSDKIELHQLYKKVADSLNISPSQHTETIFKQILGGCSAVVNGLGNLRNKLGDAHGAGTRSVKPSPRHAELAVNLAGAMALFLVETFTHTTSGK